MAGTSRDPVRPGEPGRVPRRVQKAPEPAGDEARQVARVAEQIPPGGKVRVMIRLEGVVPEIQPPSYDKRAKRSEVRQQSVDEAAQKQILDAQQKLLAQFEGGDNRNVTRFRHAPYVAMDMTRADADRLATWIGATQPQSTDRPFTIWIEVTDKLKLQSRAMALGQVSVEEAAVHMELQGFKPALKPSTVVVIDDRVDDALHLLHGRVDAMQSVTIGSPVEIPLSATPLDPASYSLTHGTKVALVASRAAPNARIVALDITDTDEVATTEYLASALEQVLSKWAKDPGRTVAAVCVSLGDELMPSREDCDCDSDTVYLGCGVLKPAIRDYVNLLAQAQIPVVIAAGNHALYEGDVFYPGCLSTAVTVGATTGGYAGAPVERAVFSNWGPMLDLCAAGDDLVLQLDQWKSVPTQAGLYSLGKGTSFATPYVAAAFSLLLDAYPEATNALIDEALRQSGSAVESSSGVRVPEIRALRASAWLANPPPPSTDGTPTTIVTPEPTPTSSTVPSPQ